VSKTESYTSATQITCAISISTLKRVNSPIIS